MLALVERPTVTDWTQKAKEIAASIAAQLYRTWESKHEPKAKELLLFDDLWEDE